jgi:hypothetical protein
MLFARGTVRRLEPDARRISTFGPEPAMRGDIVGMVSPVGLGAEVLGRLTRAVAAGAHFSIDRFSDLYPITDAIAQFAERSATGPSLAFTVDGRPRRIELTVGPFAARRGVPVGVEDRGDTLPRLVDELAFQPFGEDEVLAATIVDRRGPE